MNQMKRVSANVWVLHWTQKPDNKLVTHRRSKQLTWKLITEPREGAEQNRKNKTHHQWRVTDNVQGCPLGVWRGNVADVREAQSWLSANQKAWCGLISEEWWLMVMVKVKVRVKVLLESDLSFHLPESLDNFCSLYSRMSAAECYAFRLSLSGAQKGQAWANWSKLICSFWMEWELFCSSINTSIQATMRYSTDASVHQLYRSPATPTPAAVVRFPQNISFIKVHTLRHAAVQSWTTHPQVTTCCCFPPHICNSLQNCTSLGSFQGSVMIFQNKIWIFYIVFKKYFCLNKQEAEKRKYTEKETVERKQKKQ